MIIVEAGGFHRLEYSVWTEIREEKRINLPLRRYINDFLGWGPGDGGQPEEDMLAITAEIRNGL